MLVRLKSRARNLPTENYRAVAPSNFEMQPHLVIYLPLHRSVHHNIHYFSTQIQLVLPSDKTGTLPPRRIYSLLRTLERSTIRKILVPSQQWCDSFIFRLLGIVSESCAITSHALILPVTHPSTVASTGRKTTPFRAEVANL